VLVVIFAPRGLMGLLDKALARKARPVEGSND
jgi:hypothetical protein